MRNKSIILCSLLFLLSACGESTKETAVVCEQQFWNGTFATCLPGGWKVLSQNDLKMLGVPEETIAAFQVSDPKGGQFDTVTVTREPLPQEMETTEYSQANVLTVSTLPDYNLIDRQTIYIDGKETALHIFSARPASDAPIRRYYQTAATQAKSGYMFTGSFPLGVTEQEASQVEFILKSVSFVDPATKTEEEK